MTAHADKIAQNNNNKHQKIDERISEVVPCSVLVFCWYFLFTFVFTRAWKFAIFQGTGGSETFLVTDEFVSERNSHRLWTETQRELRATRTHEDDLAQGQGRDFGTVWRHCTREASDWYIGKFYIFPSSLSPGFSLHSSFFILGLPRYTKKTETSQRRQTAGDGLAQTGWGGTRQFRSNLLVCTYIWIMAKLSQNKQFYLLSNYVSISRENDKERWRERLSNYTTPTMG